MKLVRGLACAQHHVFSVSDRTCFANLVGARAFAFFLSAMGYEHRTAQGPNGGAIGMVDDHTKMTDDFREFVEKMVSFFLCP